MNSQTRNPFLSLPVTDGNDLETILINAEHIIRIEEAETLSCTLYLNNGDTHHIKLSMREVTLMLDNIYGQPVTTPACIDPVKGNTD